GLNGLDVVDELRRRCPGVRILVTSGYAPAALGRDPRLDPRIPFLAKPYRLADLASKVREALTAVSY
ncbi:MAG: histidine kinase, partial [Alphaproteobacteria bacterium]